MKTPTLSLLAAGALAAAVGCSGGDSPSQPQATGAAARPGTTQQAPSDPIASVAYDFMDAVFSNDIARATQRLTPTAIENLQAQDKRFEWGASAAKLEIGEVRSENGEAAVQCMVTSDGATEELLCVLRQVDGQWRVYGVAWEGEQGGQPKVVNFEAMPTESEQSPAVQPAAGNRYVETPAPQIPSQPAVAGRPANYVQ